MKRLVILFLVVLVASTYLWPWLYDIGLAGFPGDVVTELRGYRLHVPLGLSFIITAAVGGTWWLLDPR